MSEFSQPKYGKLHGSTTRPWRAFTLVEMLVAMVVLIILIVAMVGMTNQANNIWRTSRDRVTAFQGARDAFERMTFNLSQATLNTYLDYYNAQGLSRSDVLKASSASVTSLANFVPSNYDRASELQFICGQSAEGSTTPQGANALIPPDDVRKRPTHAMFFQSPIGQVLDTDPSDTDTVTLKNLSRSLNAVGYYIDFTDDSTQAPGFFQKNVPSSWRYRLMELNQPTRKLAVYSSDFKTAPLWYTQAVDPGAGNKYTTTYPIADNVIALIIRPKSANPTSAAPVPLEVAPNYAYDTKAYIRNAMNPDPYAKLAKNQLPPLVQITLVAIDAASATRLASQHGSTPPLSLTANLFKDVSQYDSDLNAAANPTLTNSLVFNLQKQHLNYRIFTTDVSIPGAKWSQTN